MRKRSGQVASAVFVLWSGSAFAEVSDDLKFCGSLKSGAERLACYDAAARIASKPAVARTVTRTAPADAQAAIAPKAPVLEALPVRNPFDGYYAAIGGGYGVVTGRTALGVGSFGSADGGFVSAVAGRNIGFSWGIIGIEADGRWLGEKVTLSSIFLPGFLDTGTGLNNYKYHSDLAGHLSLRIGASYGDSLVFAKAGFGASRATEQFATDTSGILFCDPAKFVPFSASCGPTRFGTLSTAKVATWLPSAIFGLGIEQNWGPLFARLGVDFELTNHRPTNSGSPFFFASTVDELTWATRGTAMVGVRF